MTLCINNSMIHSPIPSFSLLLSLSGELPGDGFGDSRGEHPELFRILQLEQLQLLLLGGTLRGEGGGQQRGGRGKRPGLCIYSLPGSSSGAVR
jgi:hypothetical protein